MKKMCNNCQTHIKDLRKAVNCSSCNKPLHKECAIKDGGTFFCDVCYTVKGETQFEQITKELVIPDVIRRSYIQTYKDCPYKFYMEVIKGIQEPQNIYAKLGNDLHELFEKACTNKEFQKKHMLDEFETIWYNYPPTIFEDTKQHKALHTRAINCIDNFYKTLETLPNTPFRTEEEIIINVGEDLPKISTTLDRVDLIDGELEISDWKTGKVLVGNKLSSDMQVPLYILGAKTKYNLPVRKFTLYYLEDGKERIFERVQGDKYKCTVRKRDYYIDTYDSLKEVQHIFSQIKNGNFNIPNDTKKMFFSCKVCHLRKKEICQGAELESWRITHQKQA